MEAKKTFFPQVPVTVLPNELKETDTKTKKKIFFHFTYYVALAHNKAAQKVWEHSQNKGIFDSEIQTLNKHEKKVYRQRERKRERKKDEKKANMILTLIQRQMDE